MTTPHDLHILANAHVVEGATFIEIRRDGQTRKTVAEGVASRIELTIYVQNERNLLSVRIDAAINAGNSRAPCFSTGSSWASPSSPSKRRRTSDTRSPPRRSSTSFGT